MTRKRALGMAMLAAPFVAGSGVMAIHFGVMQAILLIVIPLAVTAWILVGIVLVDGDL